MKKLIFILFFPLFLFSSDSFIYDQKTIKKDFEKGEVEKYKLDNLQVFNIDIAKEKFLTLTANRKEASNPSDILSFGCPDGSSEFTTSVAKIDFKAQKIQCLVSKKGHLDKPLGVFEWRFTDYVNFDIQQYQNKMTVDREKVLKDNQSLIAINQSQLEGIREAQVEARNANFENGGNTGFSHILWGGILGDSKLIDVETSINSNKIVLQEGFTPMGGNFLRAKTPTQVKASETTLDEVYSVQSGVADSWISNIAKQIGYNIVSAYNTVAENSKLVNGSQLLDTIDYNPTVTVQRLKDIQFEYNENANELSGRIINLLEFYPRLSSVIDNFYILIVSILGLIGISILTLNKISNKLDENNRSDSQNYIVWGIVTVIGLILFLPTSIEKVTISDNDYKLTQSNFNGIEKIGYYTSIDLANGIAKEALDTEINGYIRNIGSVTEKGLMQTIIKKEENLKLIQEYGSAIEKCGTLYYSKALQNFSDNKNFPFPASEQWIYANVINSGNYPNYYNKVDKGGYIIDSNYVEGTYPPISLSGCRYVMEKYNYLFKNTNQLLNVIERAQNGIDPRKLETIEQITKSAYGLYSNFQFMGILALPLVDFKLKQIGGILQEQEKSRAAKLLDEEKGNDIVKDVIQNSGLYMLPGVESIHNLIASNSASLSAGAAGTITKNPILTAIGGVFGFVGSQSIAYYTTTNLVTSLILILPSIGVMIFGLIVLMKIIVKTIIYHLAAPFVLLAAFGQKGGEVFKNYLIKTLSVMAEIPLFVVSVVVAITVSSIIIMVGDPISSGLLKIMSEITHMSGENWNIVEHGSDYFVIGLTKMILHLLSFYMVFKVMITFHSVVFEALEIRSAQAFDQATEQLTQASRGWGNRI